MVRQEAGSFRPRSGSDPGYLQRFTVSYEYPVHFTERLFAPENPTLVSTLCRMEPDRRHRCLVFVDDGLLAARPALADEIAAYATCHARHMELVAPPVPVPGGEKIKAELFHVEQAQRLL